MKSRSPAPGGKKSALGGKKSELQDLPPIDSVPDGDRTFFVGGWCAEGSFTSALTRIAYETKPEDKDAAAEEPMHRVAKELEGGRFVNAFEQPESITEFTKTSVAILPSLPNSSEVDNGRLSSTTKADGDGFAVAELTHGMFVFGMTTSAIESATADFNRRHPQSDNDNGKEHEEADDDEEGAARDAHASAAYSSRPRPRYEVTFNAASAADDEVDPEDEEVDEDGNPIQPIAPEEVDAMISAMRKRGSDVTPAEISQFLTTVHGAVSLSESIKMTADPQSLKDTRHKTAPPQVAGGNGFAKPKRPTLYRRGLKVVNPADLVHIRESVCFKGIRPLVSVEPEEVTATRVASALGVATINPVDRSGKPRRKTDEEKQREIETAAMLEQASKEAALAEEEKLNAFAIPERWPTVYVSNLAFSSPIKIQGAHLRFYRCHFSGVGFADCVDPSQTKAKGGASKFLVSIESYCRVEFCECTFQQPPHTAIYAFPTSELFLSDCYFSQFAIPTNIDEVLRLSVLPPHMSSLPTPGEGSIAVHTDAARLTIHRCHFEGFGNAVVVRNTFNVVGRMLINGEEEVSSSPTAGGGEGGGEGFGVAHEANEEGQLSVRLRPTLSTITESVFLNNSCSSISFIDAKRTGVTKCFINDDACGGYYSIQLTGTSCTPQVMRCNVSGRILVGKGSRPFLYKNTGKLQVIDKNQTEASYLSPKY